MRDIYVYFSLVYFLMGGLSLYYQYKMVQELKVLVKQMETLNERSR